jgi:hypothetical protein
MLENLPRRLNLHQRTALLNLVQRSVMDITRGPSRLRFTGRLRGRKLPPGRYRLTGVASNANGSSRAVTATFTIVT